MKNQDTNENSAAKSVDSIDWLGMESAPKGATAKNPGNEHWILGTDGYECKVIRWCMEYPCHKGVWMYGYAATNYIDEILQFNPTHWMPLPSMPNSKISRYV